MLIQVPVPFQKRIFKFFFPTHQLEHWWRWNVWENWLEIRSPHPVMKVPIFHCWSMWIEPNGWSAKRIEKCFYNRNTSKCFFIIHINKEQPIRNMLIHRAYAETGISVPRRPGALPITEIVTTSLTLNLRWSRWFVICHVTYLKTRDWPKENPLFANVQRREWSFAAPVPTRRPVRCCSLVLEGTQRLRSLSAVGDAQLAVRPRVSRFIHFCQCSASYLKVPWMTCPVYGSRRVSSDTNFVIPHRLLRKYAWVEKSLWGNILRVLLYFN